MLILDPDADDNLILDPDGVVRTPTLSVVDNGDGTGAVGTIGNTDDGTANFVFVYRWSGGFVLVEVFRADRVGDGMVNLELSAGAYWATATTEGVGAYSAVSSPVFFWVTNMDEDSVFGDVWDAVTAKVQSLDLSPLFTAEMVKQTKFPATIERGTANQIIVFMATEAFDEKYNSSSDNCYPIGIATIVPNGGDRQELNARPLLTIRQRIKKAFETRPDYFPLSTVPSAYRIVIVPGVLFEPGEQLRNFDVNVLFIRVYCRESRQG